MDAAFGMGTISMLPNLKHARTVRERVLPQEPPLKPAAVVKAEGRSPNRRVLQYQYDMSELPRRGNDHYRTLPALYGNRQEKSHKEVNIKIPPAWKRVPASGFAAKGNRAVSEDERRSLCFYSCGAS